MKKIFFTLAIITILNPYLRAIAYDFGNSTTGQIQPTSNLNQFAAEVGIKSEVSLENKIIGYIKIALGFLGIIFLILIIISGFRWMTSGGNEEIINKSKSMIKSSIIGLAIILLSFIITRFVMSFILQTLKDPTTQISI
ncbi:MAG TPA: hypothetical protein PKL13_00995 [bacterium]|nr:hypothetical protein [bacterium]